MLTRLSGGFINPFPKLTPEEEEAKRKDFEDFKTQFLLDWQSNDFVGLSKLMRFICHNGRCNFNDFVMPLFRKAIKEKKLIIWDNKISYRQNDRTIIEDCIYGDVVVFKKDFIAWQQQEKSLPIPESLINLLEPDDTPTTQQLVDENEALKAKVAELEQRLSEYKELPTITKNKVMPVVYGLCCLYGNRGKPLSKSRASCGAIANELAEKFGVQISDEGLENYYNAGKKILGQEK